MIHQIEDLIEEEVKRRVATTMEPFIKYIGLAYDISPTQLYKDYMTVMHLHQKDMCKGMTLKKKPCSRAAQANGYCKMHQTQYKPSAPVRIIPSASSSSCISTMTSMKNVVRDVATCFVNE